jgi:hypothetical protein
MLNLARLATAVALIVIVAFGRACATESKADSLATYVQSIAVPESPAFAILGVTPDKVTRPASGRPLAIGLLQGVDQHGNIQNGLAIDFAPYLLLYGNSLTLSEYRGSWPKRFASHIQISLGTAKGASDNDKSMKFAAGFRANIFDFGDPRMDKELDACFTRASQAVWDHYNKPGAPPSADVQTTIKKDLDAGIDSCRAIFYHGRLPKPALDVGASPLWVSDDGQTKKLRWGGMAAWSSFKTGAGRLLAIANFQYKSRDRQPDPKRIGGFIEGRSLAGGVKARYGDPSYAFLAQAIYTDFAPKGKTDNQFLYSIGGDIKLADNLWLEMSVGGTSGEESNDAGFVSGQFKWGLSETFAIK